MRPALQSVSVFFRAEGAVGAARGVVVSVEGVAGSSRMARCPGLSVGIGFRPISGAEAALGALAGAAGGKARGFAPPLSRLS